MRAESRRVRVTVVAVCHSDRMAIEGALRFVAGDATAPVGAGEKIIVHVCNDIGGWGAGFVLALSARWPEPESAYRQWHSNGDGFQLGAIRLVPVEDDLWVANLIGQRDVVPVEGEPPIRYEAVEAGLDQLADEAYAMDASVHMPRMGCGLAGGEWAAMERIVQRALCGRGIDVVVYDPAP